MVTGSSTIGLATKSCTICWPVNLKAELEVVSLKATNSLSGKLDLEDIIGKNEFTSSNATLMKPDDSLLLSNNKSILIHKLESIVAESSMSQVGEELTIQQSLTSIIIDCMALVQEMVV